METVKRISCQLVNVEELARWGVRRAKPFVGVRRSGCAAGSGELIVDPPIVHPTPHPCDCIQQTTKSDHIISIDFNGWSSPGSSTAPATNVGGAG